VDQSLANLLKDDFGLNSEQIASLEALILDGSTVDDLEVAVVRDNSRLALAGGLPGVAGLALKKDSAIKALRNSITLKAEEIPAQSRPGRINLSLYSLVLRSLGALFLNRGFWVTQKQLARYGALNPNDHFLRGEETILVTDILKELEDNPQELYFLTTLAAKESGPLEGCASCPIGCRKPQKSGWRRHQSELAELWGLNLDDAAIPELVSDFKRLCNDLGLEAFELSGALALALKANKAPKTPEGVRALFQELYLDTATGHLLGMGREATAKAYGLPNDLTKGPKKQSPHPSATTAFLDCLGMCQQAADPLMTRPEAFNSLADLLASRYGRPFSVSALASIGQEILTREEEFALKASQVDI
jgi:aldehyde:ferredoxin oxidoreductase